MTDSMSPYPRGWTPPNEWFAGLYEVIGRSPENRAAFSKASSANTQEVAAARRPVADDAIGGRTYMRGLLP